MRRDGILLTAGLVLALIPVVVAQPTGGSGRSSGQGFGDAKEAFLRTTYDEYVRDCSATCTAQCSDRWRRINEYRTSERIPVQLQNTAACLRRQR